MNKFGYKAMFNSMLALGLCLTSLQAQAQPEKDVVTDTTEITVGKKIITIVTDSASGKKDVRITSADEDDKDGARRADWHDSGDGDGDEDKKKERKSVDVDFFNLDLGVNFLTYDMDFNLPPEYSMLDIKPLNSTNVGLHFLRTKLHMARGHINLITALTLDNNRYAFRENFSILEGQDSLTLVPDSLSYRKNKLIVWHAQIPLLLNFQTAPDEKSKNFHLSVGGYAGLLISAHTKQKTNEGDKVKRSDDYNLERFRYGAMARIGYRNFEFYAKYDLSNLFAEDQGPEVRPFTFGISITGML